ncbi:hypothetical protein ABZS61_20355 [Streptomyces sp. NPDC005566]|uniref:hypothetical protein n=1 Tax=Streptomyces sp. NPDC005566 TaxID=3156886 RepID=UPI0033BD001B
MLGLGREASTTAPQAMAAEGIGAEEAAFAFAAAGVGDRVEAGHAGAHVLPCEQESFSPNR